MGNTWFQFKKFKINQEKTAMKVGVDSVLLGAWTDFANSKNILDIGAGTGLLSFMAEQKTNAKITAIEIDKDACKQCSENISLNKKEEKIHLINTSIQHFAKGTNTTFDYIISNPPYFENSFKSEISSRNTARHTEELSYIELILSVVKLLSAKGKFSLILPFKKHELFMQLSLQNGLFCIKQLIIFPKQNKEANRIILEFSKIKSQLSTDEIFIRNNETNLYSAKYKQLTKDFYL